MVFDDSTIFEEYKNFKISKKENVFDDLFIREAKEED